MGNKAVGVAHLWGMEVVETGDVCGVDHEDRLVGVGLVEGEAGGEGAEGADAAEADGVGGDADMGEAVDFYACVLGIDDSSGSCLGACLGEGCLGEGVYVAVAVGDEGEGVGLCGVAELSVLPAYLVDYSHGVGELCC